MKLAVLPKPQLAHELQARMVAEEMSLTQRAHNLLEPGWNQLLVILLLVLLCSQLLAYLLAKINACKCSRRRRVRFVDDYKDVEHIRVEQGFGSYHDPQRIIFDSDAEVAEVSRSVIKNK